MSAHQRVLGWAAVKFCPIRSGASRGRWPATVVFFPARGWRPRRPAAFISRQTRLAAIRTPRAMSSARTRRTPGWPCRSRWISRIVSVSSASVRSRSHAPGGAPPVVALAERSELVAHERDRELLGLSPVRDRRVCHGCSVANQAAAFFAESRSILSTALSLRSRSSSARSVSDRSLSWTPPLSVTFFTPVPKRHLVDADASRHLDDRSARIEMQANGLVPVLLGEASACRHAISSAGTQRQSRPGVYKIGYGPALVRLAGSVMVADLVRAAGTRCTLRPVAESSQPWACAQWVRSWIQPAGSAQLQRVTR